MPTKTIYVADADLPIFERAQALAGDNLSATIVQALRRFVQAHDAGRVGMDVDVDIDLDGGFGAWRSERRSHGHARGKIGEIAVQVGDNGTYVTRRFFGRELARRRIREREQARVTTLIVYQTAKGRLALHTAVRPDWTSWSAHWASQARRGKHEGTASADTDWSAFDWAAYGESNVLRLDVYDTPAALCEHVPPELFAAVDEALRGSDAEFLDI
jgi:EXLDI family protein